MEKFIDDKNRTFIAATWCEHAECIAELTAVGAVPVRILELPVPTSLQFTVCRMPDGWTGESDDSNQFHYIKDQAGRIRIRVTAMTYFYTTVVFTRYRADDCHRELEPQPVVYDMETINNFDINACDDDSDPAGIIWRGPSRRETPRERPETLWKPPPGLLLPSPLPQIHWRNCRIRVLEKVIRKYKDAGCEPNPEWSQEIRTLISMIPEPSEVADRLAWSLDPDEAMEMAEKWLDEHYPDWNNPAAYWT